MTTLAFLEQEDRNRNLVLDEWVCVLLRGGGFRPCRIAKVRSSLGPEHFCKLVELKRPIQGWRLARAEAKEWAEDLGLAFKDWP